jgi:phage terminase large subunit-like protein
MPVRRLAPPKDWPTLGWGVIDWIETYLCHGPGVVKGQPLELDDEFAQFILDAYRIFPKGHAREGHRVVGYGVISMPKGRAKSELAAALACAELKGPVRFSHWDGDEPVGKPVPSPLVRLLATEEGQTGNTYKGVQVMLEHAIEHHPDLFSDLDVGATRVYMGVGGRDGEIRPCTAGAASKDGGLETFAVADEIHLYCLPELRDMHSLVQQNSVKRPDDPWMLATTTMFEPGAGSVAEDQYDEAERLLALKQVRDHDFLFVHREGLPVTNWADDEQVLASLREAYEPVLDWFDVHNVLKRAIRAPGATEPRGRRYFLNLKWQGENKAVDPFLWDNLRSNRTVDPGTRVLLGFDGAEKGEDGDHTVLVGWTVEETPHLFLLGAWTPELNERSEWWIPKPKVKKRMAEVLDIYDVVELAADPPYWREQLDQWSEDMGRTPEGDEKVVYVDTNSYVMMTEAVERFLEALSTGAFTHDGSPELRWYALNAILQETGRRGQHKALIKPKKTEKIDGLIAAVLSYLELAHFVSEPAAEPFVVFA